MNAVKEEAKKLLDHIPDTASWDDIMYEFYLRQKVEASLKQMEAGEVVSQEEVERELQA
ncbi:MAG: hypothetical protein ABFC77_02335 [Thermoguttaceae bacterium]